MTSRILLLGPPNVGKTHYGAVLLEKWQVNNSALKLITPVEDLTAFNEARHYLSEGKAAPHTSGDRHKDTHFALKTNMDKEINLVWPDYGGEQLNSVLASRRIPSEWCSRIQEATTWFILIRPSLIQPLTDILTSVASRTNDQDKARTENERRWDTNAWWIELLQILLAVEGISYINKISKPRLVIGLSCWDELSPEERQLGPLEIFKSKLPLFASFIESNWNMNSWSVWGISALGKHLSDNSSDENYIDSGPAENGYVVKPDGSQSLLLDLPLEWLIESQV